MELYANAGHSVAATRFALQFLSNLEVHDDPDEQSTAEGMCYGSGTMHQSVVNGVVLHQSAPGSL